MLCASTSVISVLIHPVVYIDWSSAKYFIPESRTVELVGELTKAHDEDIIISVNTMDVTALCEWMVLYISA